MVGGATVGRAAQALEPFRQGGRGAGAPRTLRITASHACSAGACASGNAPAASPSRAAGAAAAAASSARLVRSMGSASSIACGCKAVEGARLQRGARQRVPPRSPPMDLEPLREISQR